MWTSQKKLQILYRKPIFLPREGEFVGAISRGSGDDAGDPVSKRQKMEVMKNATAVETSLERRRRVGQGLVKKTNLSFEYKYVFIHEYYIEISKSSSDRRIFQYDQIHALILGFEDGVMVSLKLWPKESEKPIFVHLRTRTTSIQRDELQDTIWACDSPVTLDTFSQKDEKEQKRLLQELGVTNTQYMTITERNTQFQKFDVYELLAPELKSRYESYLSEQLLAPL